MKLQKKYRQILNYLSDNGPGLTVVIYLRHRGNPHIDRTRLLNTTGECQYVPNSRLPSLKNRRSCFVPVVLDENQQKFGADARWHPISVPQNLTATVRAMQEYDQAEGLVIEKVIK